jgi:hypothetical protein
MKRIGRRRSANGIHWIIWGKICAVGKEFLESTSMHGLKYIGGDHRAASERYPHH